MAIVTQGYGDRGGSIVSQGYGSRGISIIEILIEAIGMQFETKYERDYIILAYYIKTELINILLGNNKPAFVEVEIGDTEAVEAMPSAYLFFAPTTIAENYVGPRTTTHFFTFTIKIKMGKAETPLGLFKDISRFYGIVYNRFIGDRSMSDTVIQADVNAELELLGDDLITKPLCIHRTIGGWRPPLGGGPNDIFFDILIEKRVR